MPVAFRHFRGGGGRCSRAPGGCRNRRGNFATQPHPDRSIVLASLVGFRLLTPTRDQAAIRSIDPGGRSMFECSQHPEPSSHGFDLIRARLGNPSITNSAGTLWNGLMTTLQIIGMSLCLSLGFGMLGGFARLSKIRPIRWIGTVYVSVIRGTPFIVQLFFIYFGLPQLGLQLPPMVAGVLALGLYSGSYVTEIVRGAIQSVDKGQMEAARSCGMSSGSALRHVIIPQAFLRMLPPLGNEFVSLTKNSALVSFVTISELFLVGQTIISRTFDALTM